MPIKSNLKSAIAIAIALSSSSLMSAFAVAASPDPVRLLSADLNGVRFEVTPGDPLLTPLGLGPSSYVDVQLRGFVRGGDIGEAGLPERIVWIGIPEGVGVEVFSTVIESRDWDGIRVQPLVLLPEIEHPGEGRGTPRLLESEADRMERYATGERYLANTLDAPVAEVAYLSAIRSQRVAGIRIRPALYDGSQGRLRVHTKFLVQVNFTGFSAPSASRVPAEPAFESIYQSMLLNAESASEFRRPMGEGQRARQLRGASTQGGPGAGFDIAGSWIKVSVGSKGIQKIRGQDLRNSGVSLGSIPVSELRLYTRSGVPLLSEDTLCVDCGLEETGIQLVGMQDGRFDDADFILFYGLPASGWRDEFVGPDHPEKAWLDHPYESKNFYWLTWDGNSATPPRRWATRDVAPQMPTAWTAPHYSARSHFEENFLYRPNLREPGLFWDQWCWEEINDGIGAQLYRADAPGAVETEPARFFARWWGSSLETIKTFGIPDHILEVEINSNPVGHFEWDGRRRQDVDTTFVFLKELNNTMRAEVIRAFDPRNEGRQDTQVLLFWEFHYKRRFQPRLDTIDFVSADTTGAVAYGVGPFSFSAPSTLTLLDVSDPNSPVLLQNWVDRDTTGGKAIYFHDDATNRKFYYGATELRFRVAQVEPVQIRNIASAANSADYVIITYDGYEPQAQSLAAHRRTNLPGFSSPRATVIRISDILAWYSGGRMDPTAIRNFLYDLSVGGKWSPVPSYVCFLGDASYDYKNSLGFSPPGIPAARVPTYVHGFQIRQFLSDDWLVDIDIGENDPSPPGTIGTEFQSMPDFFVGRLPAATEAEATLLVDEKVIPYETDPNYGEWRNRAIMLADDLVQGFDVDPLGGIHMQQSDSLEGGHMPLEMDRNKIYLHQYTFGVGSDKPAANADVIRSVNEGALLWNFIGHGNPFQMADEKAFVVSDVPSLTNMDRLTLCIAASCDLGKFDDATILGMGEALVKSPVGGSIATFSASELAFSGANFSLNTEFFTGLFKDPEQGFPNTLGQAIFVAKYRRVPRTNDRKFTLQGDPATRLGHPIYDVRLAVFDDETGEVLADSLPRGRRVRVEAEVHGSRDPNVFDLKTDFVGTAFLQIGDSAPIDSFKFFPSSVSHTYYTYNRGTIYRGDSSVDGGTLTARFYVPMESTLGDLGKIRIYVMNDQVDGVGQFATRVVGGSPSVVDTTGPDISLRFVRGIEPVQPDAELRISIFDEHGINITGHSVPNGIVLIIDDEIREELTDQFRYDGDSYQRGSITYRLPNLPDGNHRIRVTASDNFAQGILALNNRGESTIEFTVSQAANEAVAQVLNFPNPFSPESGTQVILNDVREISNIEVKIFTVDGELIRTLPLIGGPGQVQIGWDATDEAGALVANGVYLYQVQISPVSGGPAIQLLGRMAAVR